MPRKPEESLHDNEKYGSVINVIADRWIPATNVDGSRVLRPLKTEEVELRVTESTNRSPSGGSSFDGVVLDLETTGYRYETEHILEIGLWFFKYDRQSKRIIALGDRVDALQEVPKEIPRRISLLTGIESRDIRGSQIPWRDIARRLSNVSLVVAHNAAFDRPFVDRKIDLKFPGVWCCSMSQIDWLERGFPSAGLELLTHRHGYFFSGHRASNDVLAVMNLLTFSAPGNERSYFSELLDNAYLPNYEVSVLGTDYSSRGRLRAMHFTWNPVRKAWVRVLSKEGYDREKQSLAKLELELKVAVEFKELPVSENFSDRFRRPFDPF
jgi:DNA polymerase-3 subunit epsilon